MYLDVEKNEFYKSFWDRVKTLCKEKNIQQKQLAELTGGTVQTIYRQIVGNNSPTIIALIRMADVLGVSVQYLATGSNTDELAQKELSDLKSTLQKINEISTL